MQQLIKNAAQSIVFVALFLATSTINIASAQSAPMRYALASAVGDRLTVVYANPQTGSMLDRNNREVITLTDDSFDRTVLRVLNAKLKQTLPTSEVKALAPANASLFSLQQDVLASRQPAEVIARSFASALKSVEFDRLLLVVKQRTEARIEIQTGNIGHGQLEGIGFYIDRTTRMKSSKTGNVGTGFLAPFIYLRLIVADSEGRVISEQRLAAAPSISMGDAPNAIHPWDRLDAAGKVKVLEGLIDREIGRALPQLLGVTSR